eukprot:6118653-Amphidinium_carterae.1
MLSTEWYGIRASHSAFAKLRPCPVVSRPQDEHGIQSRPLEIRQLPPLRLTLCCSRVLGMLSFADG